MSEPVCCIGCGAMSHNAPNKTRLFCGKCYDSIWAENACLRRVVQAASVPISEIPVDTWETWYGNLQRALVEAAEVLTLPCDYETDYGPDKVDCALCDTRTLCAALQTGEET